VRQRRDDDLVAKNSIFVAEAALLAISHGLKMDRCRTFDDGNRAWNLRSTLLAPGDQKGPSEP
jgi:hypothetical protein